MALPNNPKSEATSISLVKYIAMDMLPLSHVEGLGFTQFMKDILSEYIIPSRTVIKNRLELLYESVRNDILEAFHCFPYISITTDGWSSRLSDSFMTITAHAIDDLWNMRSVTVDTNEMSESHTAENIYKYLCKALSEWKIVDKTIAVVHDNAPNMIAAMRTSSSSNVKIGQSVRCFCHTLQLVIEKAFKEDTFKKHLQKVSAIVGHFKHSNKATKALSDAQKEHNLPDHCLISYCVTRWNSAYAMMERILEQPIHARKIKPKSHQTKAPSTRRARENPALQLLRYHWTECEWSCI
ncbi:Similar to ZBED1: E3 SUMO-protein ligase ZBED1 (Homo sapiens) [Cotesia congregata]|uniref:Similar to ZBED1: E3 SUMO-protein ligase ZBED1 (Homo sapiens) n=1 Tax=Cotesia congregata TaxID=51543 RepID=A0A8J2EIR6_COTCN|nr:Similar to ZBED1: E3 SUMO-protein ligase ZBED1 (Homo sapiens) [Cotesia congregata]